MFGMDKIQLYRALANASAAGLSPARVLRTSAERDALPVLADIAKEIDGGALISDAMRRRPDMFPPWQSAVVAAGEGHGDLSKTFALIADSLERNRNFWMSLLPKLAYPFLLVLFAPFALNSGMIMVDGVAAYLIKVGVSLLPIFALGYAAYLGFIRLKSRPDLLGRVPIAGGVVRGNLAHYLGILVAAGLNFAQALSLAGEAAGLSKDHRGLGRATEKWKTGATAREILEELGLFEREELDLIETGELSGKLDKELQHLSETIHGRNEAALQTVLYVVPAVVVILIGLFIAKKIIGFYTGRFDALAELGLL